MCKEGSRNSQDAVRAVKVVVTTAHTKLKITAKLHEHYRALWQKRVLCTYIDEDHNLEAFEGLAHFVKSLRVVTAGDLLQHLPKERQGSEGWDFANRDGNIVRPHEGKAQK